jgi:hypothetical protein
MYRNMLEFTIDANNTTIEIGIVGTFDLKQSWCIAGMFELFDLDDAASVSSPTDVTYAITNPGFEYRNLTGWTTNGIAYQDNEWSDKTGLGFMENGNGTPDSPIPPSHKSSQACRTACMSCLYMPTTSTSAMAMPQAQASSSRLTTNRPR